MLVNALMSLFELVWTGIVSIIMGIVLAVLIVNKIKVKLKLKNFTLSKPEIITFKIILSFVFMYIIFNCIMYFGIFEITPDDF